MKASYKAEVEQYISTITDDTLISFIIQNFKSDEVEIEAAEILFNREGNELKTLTLPVLMVALGNIDRFLAEKIEDSEKLDWSLFVVSTERLQSIVSNAEFTLDGMASEVRLIELPKEEIIRAKAKEELLGSYNITNSGVKDSYVKSNMNIIDNTISINVYASQYVIKPIEFNLSNKDIETSIYNTDYTELNVFINADNKEVSLTHINYELEKEKKEITDNLVKHLGKLFKSLGITSNIKAKYIAAMMYDTSIQGTKDAKGIHEDLKDKLLNYDDEALAKIVRDKQKEIIADEVIRSINQKEYCITGSNMAYTNENVFRQLTVITLQNIKNKYCIKTDQFGNNEIKATLFIKDFTNDEIIEIINKVKEYYTKIDSNTGAKEVGITCNINYNIV